MSEEKPEGSLQCPHCKTFFKRRHQDKVYCDAYCQRKASKLRYNARRKKANEKAELQKQRQGSNESVRGP